MRLAHGGPKRCWLPAVPGPLPHAEGRASEDRLHRQPLQRGFQRALSGRVPGEARVRLPGLEHPLPRQRDLLHARARTDRHRGGRALAARRGRHRASRPDRQFRWRIADGRLPVPGRGTGPRTRRGRQPTRSGRSADSGRSLHLPQCSSGPARGPDLVDGPVGRRRERPGLRRLGTRHVRAPERPAVFTRIRGALPRRPGGAQPSHYRLGAL